MAIYWAWDSAPRLLSRILASLATSSAQWASVMVSVWELAECPTPFNLGTSSLIKLRLLLLVIGSTVWSLFQDATRICLAFLWLVRTSPYMSLPYPICTVFLVGRLNRPGLMIYGGTIRPGSCEGAQQLDIVSAFQSYGKYLQDGQTPKAEKERYLTVRHACPGPGACGGVCDDLFERLVKLTLMKDVHCKYDGQCRRSPRDDTPWLILVSR
jgi:hypothetical protein